MVTVQLGSYLGTYSCKVLTSPSRAISDGIRDTGERLVEPLEAQQRLYFLAKVTAIALETAFMWFSDGKAYS
jgi:hypothetical protein